MDQALIDDPYFYLIALVAFLFVGISKAGFGAGLGSLAVPLMALRIPVLQAGAIILPALLIIDLFTLWLYRARGDWSHLRIMLPGALLGTLVGYLTFRYLHDDAIRLILGAIAVGLALSTWYRNWRLRGRPFVPARRSWIKGGFWSAVSGTVSFVANAGGPAIAVYLLPLRLDKSAFVGTMTVFFAVLNYLKVVPYWALGQFTAQNVATAAVLLPVALVGVWLGRWLHLRLDEAKFYRWVYVMLFVTGLKLLWDGAAGLMGGGAG